MLLFLNSKCNFPSNTKIAPNSTNINKIDILTVLQDSFIHEEYNDIFNNTKYAAEAAQNHCLVHALKDVLVSTLKPTVISPSSSSPFILYGRVNVASLLTCDEQVANTPCSHVTSMNGEHVPFFSKSP